MKYNTYNKQISSIYKCVLLIIVLCALPPYVTYVALSSLVLKKRLIWYSR